MENNYKSGFSRRSGEDRREYGNRRFSEEGQRTPRPKRPRIGRPSQGGEKLFSSSDERKFIPAGERSGYSGFGGRKNEYGERREGGRREYGSRTQGERRNYGTRNSDCRPGCTRVPAETARADGPRGRFAFVFPTRRSALPTGFAAISSKTFRARRATSS